MPYGVGALPFLRLLSNWAGRIARTKEAGAVPDASVGTGTVTQTRQVSAEEPDKERAIMRG